MFESGISVKNLIDELKNTEVDIALDIPNATYVTWLNSLQQLLYTEIIKEQKKAIISAPQQGKVSISSIEPRNNECSPIFEDIYTVFAKIGDENVQLIKSPLTSGVIFPNTYYKDNNDIGYNTKETPSELTIVYLVRPALVCVDTNDEIDNGTVKIPVEFIDLVKAKLRGEAYKLANEDAIAAKWLNDYNVFLETFKAWIATKATNFGM
jgi:hypothetical protein